MNLLKSLLENEVLIRMVKGTAKWKQASMSDDIIDVILVSCFLFLFFVFIIGETTDGRDYRAGVSDPV